MRDISSAIDLLQCPICNKENLEIQRESVVCSTCMSEFPLKNGIPNFIIQTSDVFDNDFWQRAQIKEGYQFWETIAEQSGFIPDKPSFWKKHADAQYTKYLHYRHNNPPKTCLEVGGGDGPRIYFVPANIRIAIDPLMSYQERLFPEVYENIVCLDALAEQIPIRDNCIDYVVLSNCLDHFAKPELGLKEILRILTPDGLIFIALETFTSLWKMWDTFRDKTHEYRWTAEEQRYLITCCGGKIVYFEVDPSEIQDYYQNVLTSFKYRLKIFLKKMQTSWIFVEKR